MGCQLLSGEVLGFMDVAAHFGSIHGIHWVIKKEQEEEEQKEEEKEEEKEKMEMGRKCVK